MRYIEIVARVASSDAEAACDALRTATGRDVWVEQHFSQRNMDNDAQIDGDAPAIVHAYTRAYGAAERANGIARDVDAAMRDASIAADVSTRIVDEEDWAESWKEFFHVERFGERIVVVPSWRTHDAQPDDVVITLDPGMAFGTGQHETTRMCLEALERSVGDGARVLDVGCGSGILSLAAAKLGAREVLATDIDENCVRITDENAAANSAAAVVRARQGSAGDLWPFEAPPRGFDIVVANIIARVIIDLAPSLVDALAPEGRLIVSGIIGEREAATVTALETAGARIEETRAMGEWRCIEAVRA